MMEVNYINNTKAESEVVNLNSIFEMNNWLDKSKSYCSIDNERINCIEVKEEYIKELGLTNIDKNELNNINLLQFIEKYKADIIKSKDKKIFMEIQLVNISNGHSYFGFLNIGQDNKIFLIDEDNNIIQISETTKYYAYFSSYYKIIPKTKDLMTLDEYVNIIKNSNNLKKYIHKITFEGINAGYRTNIYVYPYEDGFQYKNMNNQIIDNIKEYFNFNIKSIQIY